MFSDVACQTLVVVVLFAPTGHSLDSRTRLRAFLFLFAAAADIFIVIRTYYAWIDTSVHDILIGQVIPFLPYVWLPRIGGRQVMQFVTPRASGARLKEFRWGQSLNYVSWFQGERKLEVAYLHVRCFAWTNECLEGMICLWRAKDQPTRRAQHEC